MLVASHTHWGGEKKNEKRKKVGSQEKNEEAKQVLMEKGLKAEEYGRAESGVLPSIVPWSQQLLPAWSLCSSYGTALVNHPQAY